VRLEEDEAVSHLEDGVVAVAFPAAVVHQEGEVGRGVGLLHGVDAVVALLVVEVGSLLGAEVVIKSLSHKFEHTYGVLCIIRPMTSFASRSNQKESLEVSCNKIGPTWKWCYSATPSTRLSLWLGRNSPYPHKR
jgi:hypothetical protein